MNAINFHSIYQIKSNSLGDISFRYRRCPLCKKDNSETTPSTYSLDVWHIISCGDCGFVYIDKAPVYDELKINLAWEKTSQIETQRRQEIRPISHKVSKLARWRFNIIPRTKFSKLVRQYAPAGRVIDIGCGSGNTLSDLDEMYLPNGIEISTELAKQAHQVFSRRGGSCIHASGLDGLKQLPDYSHSAATLRSYLEHEYQPLEVLTQIYRILVADGVAIIKVPNYNCLNRMLMGKKWCGFRYPDHQNYFTPYSLRAMAKVAGFNNFLSHQNLPTSDNMYLVLKK